MRTGSGSGAAPAAAVALPRPLGWLGHAWTQRAAAVVALLIAAPLPLMLLRYAITPRPLHGYGWDFRAFYAAGRAYLEHRSPYPPPTLAALTSQQNFVYPLPAAAVFAPVALLPLPVTLVFFVLCSAACLVAALRVLGVRDPRCYWAALFCLPAQEAVRLGTLMPALALLLALVWRYRDRRAVAVPALAALALAKLFLWPLGVWFIATRRTATALLAAAAAAAAVAVSTLPYGLGILHGYPTLLRLLSDFEAPFGYSPLGLALDIGLPRLPATAGVIVIGAGLLVGVVVCGRRGDEDLSFRLALATAFVLTPIVWSHYFVLLFVPLALRRPRFSPLWIALAWAPGSLLAAFDGRAALVAPALLLAAAQLDLLRFPRLNVFRSSALALGVVAGAFLAAETAAAAHLDRFAALRPGGGSTASGAAYLRLRQARNDVCWQVWTEGIAVRTARAWLVGPARQRVELAGFRLDPNGNSHGCSPLGPVGRRVVAGTSRRPWRYRLVVTGRGGTVSGLLWRPINAPKPR